MQSFSKELWAGPEKLVIGIDIGTTHSAVSYAHLYPGGPYSLTRVGQWAGQPEQRGTKIPSLIYYNDKKEAVMCGAEAASPDAKDEAEEKKWGLARHFKLLLHPPELRVKDDIKTDKLPYGVTVEQIYADFLRYLVSHTRNFFEARTNNGAVVWRDLIRSADVVIAHPNAWGLREQNVLRRAAIRADVVSPNDAGAQIHFVSEGEASVHFCMSYGNMFSKFETGTRFLVCDAGGSTVDTTAYVVRSIEPHVILEEAKASACVQAGGVFVNEEAARQVKQILGSAAVPRTVLQDWIHSAEEDFETNLKLDFPRPNGRHSLAVDRQSYNNPAVGIKNGRLNLDHDRVASFFTPSIEQIKISIKAQLYRFDAQHILLVGGYGESRFLRLQLQETFATNQCQFTIIDDGTSKAVSDGAVIWSCLHGVRGRRTRRSYGIEIAKACSDLYGHVNIDGREPFVHNDGELWIDRVWGELICQDTLVKEDVFETFGQKYSDLNQATWHLKNYSLTIYSYNGVLGKKAHAFVGDPRGALYSGFEAVCQIKADLSNLAKAIKPRTAPSGWVYYQTRFDVCLTFGETELKAYIQWTEGGVKKRGPATVIPHGLTEDRPSSKSRRTIAPVA